MFKNRNNFFYSALRYLFIAAVVLMLLYNFGEVKKILFPTQRGEDTQVTTTIGPDDEFESIDYEYDDEYSGRNVAPSVKNEKHTRNKHKKSKYHYDNDYAGSSDQQVHMEVPDEYVGHARLLEMPATQRGEKVVQHTGYVLSYNAATNCPNWVAWELTRDEANAHGKRNQDFFPDPEVESRNQVTTSDYSGSGYTRGHMCPSGDMKWSGKAQHDCFYMSNMCPQTKALNADSWERLESSCRRWAKQEGSVYIVCGPVFQPDRKVRTIGRQHKVRVPDGFFKVVLSMKKGEEKAIGFYYANNDREQTMESAAMSVDDVERMTGYNFFHLVSDNIENRVESDYDLKTWH